MSAPIHSQTFATWLIAQLNVFEFGDLFDLHVLKKTIQDGGITVDFWIMKVHTSN